MKIGIMGVSLVLGASLCSLVAAMVLGGNTSELGLVPAPEKVERQRGVFELGRGARIVVDATARSTGQYLAERLRTSTGYPVPVINEAEHRETRKNIFLTTQGARTNFGPEGYELKV